MSTSIASPATAIAAPMSRPRLSESGVKSFLAHVAGIAGGAVLGLAAAVVFAVVAPTIFAYVAAGTVALAAGLAGAKAGDVYYHWSRGEEMAGAATFQEHMRSHFGGVGL